MKNLRTCENVSQVRDDGIYTGELHKDHEAHDYEKRAGGGRATGQSMQRFADTGNGAAPRPRRRRYLATSGKRVYPIG